MEQNNQETILPLGPMEQRLESERKKCVKLERKNANLRKANDELSKTNRELRLQLDGLRDVKKSISLLSSEKSKLLRVLKRNGIKYGRS